MGLIFDTHVLIWMLADDRRLSGAARAAITDGAVDLFLSALTAWEFADLQQRGRLPPLGAVSDVTRAFDMAILDVPADLWRLAAMLPAIHGDPVDRMLIAHAMHAGLTLVTADETMRRYSVPTFW